MQGSNHQRLYLRPRVFPDTGMRRPLAIGKKANTRDSLMYMKDPDTPETDTVDLQSNIAPALQVSEET